MASKVSSPQAEDAKQSVLAQWRRARAKGKVMIIELDMYNYEFFLQLVRNLPSTPALREGGRAGRCRGERRRTRNVFERSPGVQ